MAIPVERRLDLGWGELSVLTWPNPGKPRAICLHGWMDNAASFMPLSPHLDELDLVALDFAGQGHSDHRPAGTNYYFVDNLFDVDAVLDALGWDSCGVIGHSLGAGIGSAFACAAPERVDWLVMLDGIGAITEPPEQTRERISQSLKSVRKPRRHERVYPTIEDAAGVRKANNPMAPASARLLAQRAVNETEKGFRWRTDPRLLWNSPVLMTEEQAVSLLTGIHCPALAITTKMLAGYLGDRLANRLAAIPGVSHLEIGGDHHVHMDRPELLAPTILTFLSANGVTQ